MNMNKPIWITKETTPFKTDYQIGNQIGSSGNFAKAYRCKRRVDSKIFAVKCISKSILYDNTLPSKHREYYLQTMKSEINIMKKLNHKYIINLEEVYEDRDRLYIIMNECNGGELFDRITVKKYNEYNAKYIIKQLLQSLDYLHNQLNIIHCDLKCSNILFMDNTDKSSINLIDFGMSKQHLNNGTIKAKQISGTPYFMSPELLRGDNYDYSVDLWSLGVIMFVMIFGFQPFWVDDRIYRGQKELEEIYKLIQKGFDNNVRKGFGPHFPSTMPISNECMDLISKLLERDPKKRISAKDALNHSWILNASANNNNSDITSDLSQLTINL